MATGPAPQQFDRISHLYDETREPPDAETIARLASALRERGVSRLLEIGVGTGRIARPLAEQGLDLTGIDASRGMLARARSKELRVQLVRGSAYRLPFRSASFDGSLFVHVLHLLEDRRRALREALRVASAGAFELVQTGGSPGESGGGLDDPRRSSRAVFFRHLAAEGYPVPDRLGGPWRRDRELLQQVPPDETIALSERTVTRPALRGIEIFAKGASRATIGVPPEALERAAAATRAELGDRTVSYRRVESLARWTAASRPRLGEGAETSG